MAFDPITLIGAAISGIGSIMSGMATAAAAQEQARIAEMNAAIMQENSDRAIHRSQIEAQDQDALTLAMIGQQEALQSASGLSGRSQLLVRKSARELGRKDALNVRQAGEIEAYNYRVEGANQSASANVYRMQASNSMLSGFLGAAQSLIGAAQPSRQATRYRSNYSIPAFGRTGGLLT